jgi:hypothetical protein
LVDIPERVRLARNRETALCTASIFDQNPPPPTAWPHCHHNNASRGGVGTTSAGCEKLWQIGRSIGGQPGQEGEYPPPQDAEPPASKRRPTNQATKYFA